MSRIHRQDGVDLLTRAIAPGVVVWGVIVGIGLLLKGPLLPLSRDEESVSKDLASHRTTTWNSITAVWSHLGNTEIVIGVCVVVAAILLWRTRNWRLAVTPVIAIALQATIFVIATHVIGRPRPHVTELDPAPPTSSYPSGHVGASFALYLTFTLLAMAIKRTWLRWLDLGAVHARPAAACPTPGSTAACTTSPTSSSAWRTASSARSWPTAGTATGSTRSRPSGSRAPSRRPPSPPECRVRRGRAPVT